MMRPLFQGSNPPALVCDSSVLWRLHHVCDIVEQRRPCPWRSCQGGQRKVHQHHHHRHIRPVCHHVFSSFRNQKLGLLDYGFTAIFAIECMLKMLDLGMFLHPGSYMRWPWPWRWSEIFWICHGEPLLRRAWNLCNSVSVKYITVAKIWKKSENNFLLFQGCVERHGYLRCLLRHLIILL